MTQRTVNLIGVGILILLCACIVAFLTSCANVDGVTRTQRVKLNVISNAPSRYINQPGGSVDGYRVYYSTNPDDLEKPLAQQVSVDGLNRPAAHGQPDSIAFDITIRTGRTYYFKAYAFNNEWVQLTPDTLRGDSTLQTILSQVASNYATRTYPLEANDKPAAPTSIN